MKLETDSRVHAQAYIHGHTVESPCKVACALIRNLLDDLSAANGEIRSLQRERSQLQRRIEEQYELVNELANKNKDRSKNNGHDQAAPEPRRSGNSG